MSGGFADYASQKIRHAAQEYVQHYQSERADFQRWSKPAIVRFKKAVYTMFLASEYEHHIDWRSCDDIGDEALIERMKGSRDRAFENWGRAGEGLWKWIDQGGDVEFESDALGAEVLLDPKTAQP